MATTAAAAGPNPVDVHVGQRVRMRRLMVGVTQTQLADQLDLTFQQIQKYEKGTNRVSASKLYAIGQILKVPPEYFFEGLPPIGGSGGGKNKIVDETHILTTADGIELVRAFKKIQQKPLRRQVLGLVKTLADSLPS
jgi:transcriptional regulator with XRE-family HTH domain